MMILDDIKILNKDRFGMTDFSRASGSNMAPSSTGSFPRCLNERIDSSCRPHPKTQQVLYTHIPDHNFLLLPYKTSLIKEGKKTTAMIRCLRIEN